MLPDLLNRLGPVLCNYAREFEVIMVNDCSRDDSWDVIVEQSRKFSWLRGVNLMRNYGQHNAVLCGIRVARYELVVTMDDDLQNPPEEIPKLLSGISEGRDVVYGTPARQQHGLFRGMASQITKMVLQGAMGAETARRISAFRMFRTFLRDAFSGYRSPFVNIDVLLTWGTSSFSSIPVRHEPRREGVSNYTVRKLVLHALNMMTGFSTLPLQIASIIGFSLTLFGIGVLLYVVGKYFILGYSIPGFPFLASIISIFSGAQLFALGMIGEYLARMHFRSMEKPSYVIRNTTE